MVCCSRPAPREKEIPTTITFWESSPDWTTVRMPSTKRRPIATSR